MYSFVPAARMTVLRTNDDAFRKLVAAPRLLLNPGYPLGTALLKSPCYFPIGLRGDDIRQYDSILQSHPAPCAMLGELAWAASPIRTRLGRFDQVAGTSFSAMLWMDVV